MSEKFGEPQRSSGTSLLTPSRRTVFTSLLAGGASIVLTGEAGAGHDHLYRHHHYSRRYRLTSPGPIQTPTDVFNAACNAFNCRDIPTFEHLLDKSNLEVQ